MKICNGCNIKLPLTSFSKNKDGALKVRSICKKCDSTYQRLHYIKWLTKADHLIVILKAKLALNKEAKKNIKIEDLLNLWKKQDGICAISGIKMTHVRGKGRINTNVSIDRIENNRGYTLDNIQLVCDRVNIMKNTMSLTELIYFCNEIVKNNEL